LKNVALSRLALTKPPGHSPKNWPGGNFDFKPHSPTDIKLSLQTQQLATGSEATAGFHSKECVGVAKTLGGSWKSLSNNILG